MKYAPEPCMCGATDCRYCYPNSYMDSENEDDFDDDSDEDEVESLK